MVKDKPDSIRTYDSNGYKRRAACICFKDETEQEVLLVTSSGSPSCWVVPGGGVEPLEDCRLAAEREALEEAGVRGHVVRSLGENVNEERKTRTAVFVLIVSELLDIYDDLTKVDRKRKWFKVDEAMLSLEAYKPALACYLNHAHGDSDRCGTTGS